MGSPRLSLAALAVASMLGAIPAQAASADEDPHTVISRALAVAPDIPGQAAVLVELIWPKHGAGDPLVAATARHELVDYGEFALGALRQAFKTADPRWQADIMGTFVEAAHTITSGQPADVLPGLEEGIWFGSPAGRRIAIREMARYKYPPAVLPIIDAIDESPELTIPGMRALGQMGDGRARFYLSQVLLRGSLRLKREAAQALAGLDDAGLIVLRVAVRSESRAQREAAFSALLPVAKPEDADMVHRYVADHPDDDPALLKRAAERGAELEEQLEAKRDSEAASGEEQPPGP
jgi:hypothetical protein